MSTKIVIDCDPGHDDAIAILLALASPEVELTGVTTVAGNQTLDKTTRNALVTLEIAGRSDIPVAAGAEAPLRRELRTAAHVHGETGLDGPELHEPSSRPVGGPAADFLAELSDFFQQFHERSYGFGGSPIHDAMAIAHVIDPTLVTTRHANVAVETRSELCDGRTVVDLRGVTGREPNADVGVDVDAERFLELLVSRIASLP